jgi:hypothetical protein
MDVGLYAALDPRAIQIEGAARDQKEEECDEAVEHTWAPALAAGRTPLLLWCDVTHAPDRATLVPIARACAPLQANDAKPALSRMIGALVTIFA